MTTNTVYDHEREPMEPIHRLILLLTLIGLTAISVWVGMDAYSSYRMARIGFCYQRVESPNVQPSFTWMKCK